MKTTSYICDICGRVIHGYDHNSRIKTSAMVSEEVAKEIGRRFVTVDLDLCEECMEKAVVVEEHGPSGEHSYKWRERD